MAVSRSSALDGPGASVALFNLKQKLALMAREHPEFHSALEEFYRLQSAYEDERRERFRDSWFVR